MVEGAQRHLGGKGGLGLELELGGTCVHREKGGGLGVRVRLRVRVRVTGRLCAEEEGREEGYG